MDDLSKKRISFNLGDDEHSYQKRRRSNFCIQEDENKQTKITK